jgi:hypothetical protein
LQLQAAEGPKQQAAAASSSRWVRFWPWLDLNSRLFQVGRASGFSILGSKACMTAWRTHTATAEDTAHVKQATAWGFTTQALHLSCFNISPRLHASMPIVQVLHNGVRGLHT